MRSVKSKYSGEKEEGGWRRKGANKQQAGTSLLSPLDLIKRHSKPHQGPIDTSPAPLRKGVYQRSPRQTNPARQSGLDRCN